MVPTNNLSIPSSTYGGAAPMVPGAAPGAPPVLDAQQQARQKAISDVLRSGAMTAPQGQMVGNRYVAPSATQTLGQLASAAGYGYLNKG